jgi:hypothetical protein
MIDNSHESSPENVNDKIRQGVHEAGLTMSAAQSIPGRQTKEEDDRMANEARAFLSRVANAESHSFLNGLIYHYPHNLDHIQQTGGSRRQALFGILKDIQSKIECQMCTLFLMDDSDGTFRCDAFYGLDSNLNPIPSYNQDLLDEHYPLESLLNNIEKAVKANDSLYGDIVMVPREKFDPHYLSVIESMCGCINYAILIPINGPNRSYGLLRALYRQNDDSPSKTLVISPEHLVFLGMTSSAISSVIRDFKKQYEQELLLVMQDSILNWYQHKEQALQENYVCIRAILSNVTKYLVVDQDGPAKAATIRLFYQKTQAVSVSHWTRHNKGLKDQLQRDISNPDCILAKVANSASDLLIPNIAKHEYFSKFENKQWILDNKFRDFFVYRLILRD